MAATLAIGDVIVVNGGSPTSLGDIVTAYRVPAARPLTTTGGRSVAADAHRGHGPVDDDQPGGEMMGG